MSAIYLRNFWPKNPNPEQQMKTKQLLKYLSLALVTGLGERKQISMHSSIHLKTTTSIILLLLAYFGLFPLTEACAYSSSLNVNVANKAPQTRGFPGRTSSLAQSRSRPARAALNQSVFASYFYFISTSNVRRSESVMRPNYNSTKVCFAYFGFYRGKAPGKRNT